MRVCVCSPDLVEMLRLGPKAIPFGWTMESSITETAPVEGVKRYEAVSSWGAVSTRALNQEYSESGCQLR